MHKIRPWLYVGKYRGTLDMHLLSAYRIDAMLQLADLVEQPGIAFLYLPVDDGVPIPDDLLRKGVDFAIAEKERGHTVLIACGAGLSRSAAFAVAVLKEVEGLNLLDALRTLKQRHHQAMPHPAIWESLCTYYGEDFSFYDAYSQ